MRPGHRLPAWLLSVVMHASVLIACGLLAPVSGNPPPGEPERVVGIALVQRSGLDLPQYFSESSSGTGSKASSGQTQAPATSLGVPDPQEISRLAGIQLPQPGDRGAAVGGGIGISSAAGLTQGGAGRGTTVPRGQTSTQVFGARGTGSSFVYVFDRSSSMGGFGGRPLAAAKAELQRSLQDLVSGNQFQIIFYNEQPFIFNPFRPHPPQMFFATPENQQLAQDYLRSITPVGGTGHIAALELAFRMGPDVIFFLTDAGEPGLTPRELSELHKKNRTAAVVHTIEFGSGLFRGGENFLVRMARQNGGQHVYVDVTGLPSGM